MRLRLHPVLRYRRRLARKKIRHYDRQIRHNEKTAASLHRCSSAAGNFRGAAAALKPLREQAAAEEQRLTKLIGG